MKKLIHHSGLLLILLIVTGLFSCERLTELYRLSETGAGEQVNGPDKKDKPSVEDPCGAPVVIPLVARDNLELKPGKITVTHDDQHLSAMFEVTEANWNIDMMYLEVGPLHMVPLDEAGTYPAFWEFDYQYADVPVASYTYQIPLENLDECFVVLAQARIVDGQGNHLVLWSQGMNPGWTAGPFYTDYCIEICNGDTTSDTDPTGKDTAGKTDDDDEEEDDDDDEDDDKDDDDDDDDEDDDKDDDDDDDDEDDD